MMRMIKPVNINTAKAEDLSAIVRLERDSFPDPWSRADFLSYFDVASLRLATAIDERSRVVGYVAFKMGKRTLYVYNLCVDKTMRRLGIGSQLLQFAVDSMIHRRLDKIRCYVSESNLATQLLLKNFGFYTVPPYIARGIYRNSDLKQDIDAYIFEYTAVPRDFGPKRVVKLP